MRYGQTAPQRDEEVGGGRRMVAEEALRYRLV